MSNVKFFNNDEGVSPIVATLVLIVVAIIGAAAVGLIMGTFSTQVSNEANSGDLAGSASNTILIGGSTTVQPASEVLAKAYMAEHKGIKVTVQGGGSGAGIAGVEQDILDIGAASKAVPVADLTAYPNLKVYQIGGSAVCFIAGTGVTAPLTVTAADVYTAYTAGLTGTDLATAGVATLYTRSESSGTKDTAYKWMGDEKLTPAAAVEGVTGNDGMLSAIQNDDTGFGYVDFGYADGASDIIIAQVDDGTNVMTANKDNILAALKANYKGTTSADYDVNLVRPLNYITNGEPNTVVKDYINFARSPGAISLFHQVGMFGITEFATV